MINFPTWITDCDSHSPAILNFFLSSDTSIFTKMLFHFPSTSHHIHNGMAALLMTILVLIETVLMNSR